MLGLYEHTEPPVDYTGLAFIHSWGLLEPALRVLPTQESHDEKARMNTAAISERP